MNPAVWTFFLTSGYFNTVMWKRKFLQSYNMFNEPSFVEVVIMWSNWFLYPLLRFAGIHLCTALFRSCHSISARLRSALWTTDTPCLFQPFCCRIAAALGINFSQSWAVRHMASNVTLDYFNTQWSLWSTQWMLWFCSCKTSTNNHPPPPCLTAAMNCTDMMYCNLSEPKLWSHVFSDHVLSWTLTPNMVNKASGVWEAAFFSQFLGALYGLILGWIFRDVKNSEDCGVELPPHLTA